MCQICKDALDKHWPNLSLKQRHDLLWFATAFPCINGEVVAEQLKDIAERSGNDFNKAMDLAERDMDVCAEHDKNRK